MCGDGSVVVSKQATVVCEAIFNLETMSGDLLLLLYALSCNVERRYLIWRPNEPLCDEITVPRELALARCQNLAIRKHVARLWVLRHEGLAKKEKVGGATISPLVARGLSHWRPVL